MSAPVRGRDEGLADVPWATSSGTRTSATAPQGHRLPRKSLACCSIRSTSNAPGISRRSHGICQTNTAVDLTPVRRGLVRAPTGRALPYVGPVDPDHHLRTSQRSPVHVHSGSASGTGDAGSCSARARQ